MTRSRGTTTKVAIVTGASRGLGHALAAGLAEHGWRLVIDGRDAAALAAARANLPGDVAAVAGDITDPAHRAELIAVAAELGPLGLVVHNAGVLGPSPLPTVGQFPLDALRDLVEVTLVAPVALSQLALPFLRHGPGAGGAIVAVSSDAAVEAYPGWGGYGAAKAALDQAMRVLAVEEPTVRVWSVDPGDLRTRMHQEAFPGEDISDRPLPQTAVPAFLGLLAQWPVSGRVRLADVLVGTRA